MYIIIFGTIRRHFVLLHSEVLVWNIINRFHVLKAVKRKLVELYSKKSKREKKAMIDFFMQWAYALVFSKDLNSFDQRVKSIGIVTILQHLTPAVEKTIADMHKPLTIGNFRISIYEFILNVKFYNAFENINISSMSIGPLLFISKW